MRFFRSRFFWSLYASMSAVLLVTAAVAGLLLDHRLSSSLQAELIGNLGDHCVLLDPLAREAFRGGLDPGALDDELARLGRETGLRITLIRPEGRVIGDSHEDPAVMDDHGSRPEVLAAREGELGSSRRFSRTVGYRMVYVAHMLRDGERPLGFVRVSVPSSSVDAQLAGTRRSLFLGTIAGLLAALVLGLYIAGRFTTPIAAITRAAEGLRSGDYGSRVRLRDDGELGFLADTLNRLGEEVTRRIATISQEDAQLRAMLAGMVEGVVAIDEDDTIAFCNQAARELLGIESRDLSARKLWEVAPIAELEAVLEEARTAATAGREIELFRGGKERVVDVHAGPFRGGGRRGTVLVMHDVTELRRLERIRRDFVANVSHELKTPLTSIKGFVETLLSGALHDEQNNERFLRRIDANVERLNHLVSDLLSLARIESEREGILRSEVDCRIVLEEVSRRHEEAIRKKGLTYEVSGAAELGVLGDREALVQVLDNLLDNACKYTPAPGAVRVRLSTSEGHGILEVEDTGIGIPSGDLGRVFERFYRVDKARSRELGGTGLGLSIVKNLVAKMGGEVRVESAEGTGTRFTVELPLARRTEVGT